MSAWPHHPAFLAALTAAAWCAAHSLCIAPGIESRLRRLLGPLQAYNRLLYVLGSTVSVSVLLWWWHGMTQVVLWRWEGGWAVLRWAALSVAAVLAGGGVMAHNNCAFLGLRQIAQQPPGRAPAPPLLRRHGILGRVRHPYYGAGLLGTIFHADVGDVGLAWRGVFAVYFVIGAALEDRKLRADFGPAYDDYRREVPALLPWRPPRRR